MEKILDMEFQVLQLPIAFYTLFSTALAKDATLSIKSKGKSGILIPKCCTEARQDIY